MAKKITYPPLDATDTYIPYNNIRYAIFYLLIQPGLLS